MTLTDNLQNNTPQGRKRKPFSSFVYWLSAVLIRFVFRINGGLDVKDTDNIPVKGGVIIAPNHISYLDPPLIGAVMPRRATFMARKGLFNIPLLGFFIKYFALPVDREKPHPSTIKEIVKRLKNGELFVIFPEGKRSESGKLQEGKRGTGTIARLSNAVIVPALITGSNKALPFNARWLKRARISIAFGAPIRLSDINAGGDHPSENITKAIMYKIGELKKRHADNSS